MNFYALIIGTEILNARRDDKHFKFLRDELAKYGHTLFASFVVKDDVELIEKTFKFIKEDKESIMFSFGGIGSTPDDLTREISAGVFTAKPLVRHKEFEQDIIKRFAEEAYPHRVRMSDLPQDAALLFNPVNIAIAETINRPYSSTRFPVLNNGITVVSPDVRVQGSTLHLENFQIFYQYYRVIKQLFYLLSKE